MASASGGKASRRFWSSRLQDVYESCPLPTKTDCNTPHAIATSSFTRTTHQKTSWTHTTLTPRPTSTPSSRSLARAFAEPASGPASGNPKRTKTVAGPKQFEVTRPLTAGQQLRTFAVKMYPTAAQKRELGRCFAAARWSYNEVVKAVKSEGVHPNSAPLWKKIMTEAPPKVKEVYAKIRKRAIKQAAEAYATNERKRAKNPRHRYTVEFRSYRRTRTEVIVLEKAYLAKKCPDMGPVVKIRLTPSPLWGNGKKCAGHVFFGGTLSRTPGGWSWRWASPARQKPADAAAHGRRTLEAPRCTSARSAT